MFRFRILPRCKPILPACFLALSYLTALSQVANHDGSTKLTVENLDPARNISAELQSVKHRPLPEQYIWTKEDAVPDRPVFNSGWLSGQNEDLGSHYFRRSFDVTRAPRIATLYVAGPRSAHIYLNGRLIQSFQLNLDFPLGIRVLSCDVTSSLRKGSNVLAIEAVRGPSIGSGADSRLSVQQTQGKVLAVKIVPAAQGVDAPAILISDESWKASMNAGSGWQNPNFDDGSWPSTDSLGGIESSIEFFQWNADAGLYDWPGYDGISPFLTQFELLPVTVTHAYSGSGELNNLEVLTKPSSSGEFSVELPGDSLPESLTPQILLDFGREVDGRLAITSDSDMPSEATVQYGESEAEVLHEPYLGVDPLHVAPHTTAYGPKSAFRYALVHFTGGRLTRYKSIRLAGINYPVVYKGYFESSDEALNKMWAIGAYTAHLCMQDDIWDAPKRDRGRWMGDLDVSGRTIEDAFDDRFLMERTLDRLLGSSPIEKHVNGIAGYSAFWLIGEAEYYRHTGSTPQLENLHSRLVELMKFMEAELDDKGLYANKTNSWPFVDWAPELNGDTPESRRATQLEFYAAFEAGVYLLNQLHDTANAEAFGQQAQKLKSAAQQYLLDPFGSFGTRWQTNAFAVFSGVADPSQYDAIWSNSLSSVGHVKYNALIITPYYNYYVISAMAKMNRRKEAIDWIRQYWGGMLDEGATSFWEGYDPSWYRGNFHASLQADNISGYHGSLAHGWSSGVTPWLMEQVLGIQSRGAGFSQVDIRPDLIDLKWAKGAEPTPRGLLRVSISDSDGIETIIDLPPNAEASVFLPVSHQDAQVTVNGKNEASTLAENGTRTMVKLAVAGHYVLRAN